jgi:hypothetical protein
MSLSVFIPLTLTLTLTLTLITVYNSYDLLAKEMTDDAKKKAIILIELEEEKLQLETDLITCRNKLKKRIEELSDTQITLNRTQVSTY